MSQKAIIHELQVEAARQRLRSMARRGEGRCREMARLALAAWPSIAEALDTALLNHGYWKMTFQIYAGDTAIQLRYEEQLLPDGKRGDWKLKKVVCGPRVGWGLAWEYNLETHTLEHKKKAYKVNRVSIPGPSN